jgi:hypothetical protein
MCFPEIRHGSIGKVTCNVEIKIIDDDGKSLGPMENGELCIKVPIHFMVIILKFGNQPPKN